MLTYLFTFPFRTDFVNNLYIFLHITFMRENVKG